MLYFLKFRRSGKKKMEKRENSNVADYSWWGLMMNLPNIWTLKRANCLLHTSKMEIRVLNYKLRLNIKDEKEIDLYTSQKAHNNHQWENRATLPPKPKRMIVYGGCREQLCWLLYFYFFIYLFIYFQMCELMGGFDSIKKTNNLYSSSSLCKVDDFFYRCCWSWHTSIFFFNISFIFCFLGHCFQT